MKRIEIACYALIASAFVLGAILVYSLQNRAENQASAALLVNRDNFSVMTFKVRSSASTNDDGLFVLSNTDRKILVYRYDNKGFQLSRIVDLVGCFPSNNGGGNGGGYKGGGAR